MTGFLSAVVHAGRPLARVLSADHRHVLREAAGTLLRHPLRSALSLMSIVLGVASVVAMMSVVEGAKRETLAQASRLGLDTIVVVSRASFQPGSASSPGLTVRDASGLAALGRTLAAICPVVQFPSNLAGPAASEFGVVIGTTAPYASAARLAVARGRVLTDLDDVARARVCVVGGGLASRLWGGIDPLGRPLLIGADFYTVVGVLAGSTASETGRFPGVPVIDVDRAVVVPLAARLGHAIDGDRSQRLDELRLVAADPSAVVHVGDMVSQVLRTARGGRADFDVTVPRALVDQRIQIQQTFGLMLGSIALLALVVGGLGIMNVTLASVLERISEIGIRRSVGATRRHIASLFVTETLILGTLGGVAGLLTGAALSAGIAMYAGWRTAISPLGVVAAILVSAVVGFVSGVYPAWRASTIAPIDAVRHE